jgi:hypothetical protein
MVKKPEKSIDELLLDFHKIDKKATVKPRVLKADGEGNYLVDPKNKKDVEWMENDEGYDVIN